jgi:hypothetical protein
MRWSEILLSGGLTGCLKSELLRFFGHLWSEFLGIELILAMVAVLLQKEQNLKSRTTADSEDLVQPGRMMYFGFGNEASQRAV